MEKKTLWIHAGGSKTGSSALQNFFEFNTDFLNSQGFAYTNKSGVQKEGDIGSGNGMLLFGFFMNNTLSKEELSDVLLSYFESSLSNALCSSEFLQYLTEESVLMIIDVAQENFIEVKWIYYIRNAVSFFVSAYDQLIKRHGEWRNILETSQERSWDHLQSLKLFSKVIPKDNLYVHSYELSKSKLIAHFMDVLGVKLEQDIIQKKVNVQRVNRSLTLQERELLRRINKEFGDKYSTEISDKLIYKNPDLVSEYEWDDSLIKHLADRYHNDIKWVNDTFFNGLSVIKIYDDSLIEKSNSTLSQEDEKSIDNEVLEWCLEKIKALEENAINLTIPFVAKRLSAIDWENASNPAIPEDFNPFAYLLFNPDLLRNNVLPYNHFIQHGQFEKERVFKW
ncbi:MAG: hypothetical protein WA080_00150 [Sulfuricurvum sp.]